MITGAGQSGAQIKDAANPVDLVPGKKYSIPIELHVTSWVFPAGHKIRIAISNTLWPMIWPTPDSMNTSLYLGGADASRLELPVVPSESSSRPKFPPVEPDPPMPENVTSEGEAWPPQEWTVTHDLMNGKTRVFWSGNDSSEFPWGRMKDHEQMSYEVQDSKPETNTVHGEASTTVELPNRTLVWSVVLDLRSDAKNFYYHFERHLTENGAQIRAKTWDDTIPRDHQ
jgi:hypothetical protein